MKKNWFFAILSLFILAGVLTAFWLGGLILANADSDSISAQDPVDYVIILGCGLKEDKPDRILQSRLDTAVAFLEKYPDSIAICTGGQGEDEPIPEATAMEKALQKAGIPPERIRKEVSSKNTYENFRNAKRIIDQQAEDPRNVHVAVVTSEFHLFRATNLAKLHGFDNPIKVSAQTPTVLFYPHFIREIAALVAAQIRYY